MVVLKCALRLSFWTNFFITVVAVEWFFTSVKPFMHSQVVLLDEFLVTVEWCGRARSALFYRVVIKNQTTKSHRNPRFFCPLLRAVHYWELLLNKNCREAGFCPLLRAFPLLRSALLRALSVLTDYLLRSRGVSPRTSNDSSPRALSPSYSSLVGPFNGVQGPFGVGGRSGSTMSAAIPCQQRSPWSTCGGSASVCTTTGTASTDDGAPEGRCKETQVKSFLFF